MPPDEIRITSPTGGAKGSKPCQLFSLPPWAMEQLGEVYGFGATKYAAHNYRKGFPISLSVNALFRHVLRFLDGEDVDPESGLPHLAHAAWQALAALQTLHDYPVYDDRYKRDASVTYDVAKDILDRIETNKKAWEENHAVM